MASPAGHAMVGLGTAAVVAAAVGAPNTPALWLGAGAACILPDFDLVSELVGKKGPQFHRNASHSIFVLGSVVLLGWWLTTFFSLPVDPRQALAWVAALASHPLLDVLATGPVLGAQGYGIALFWPLSKKRFFIKKPLFETMDLSKCRSLRDVWQGFRPELVTLGPVTLAAVLFAMWMYALPAATFLPGNGLPTP
jgi:membrane-bound metal-dependent hydrolase YbcI (DUF457 family)